MPTETKKKSTAKASCRGAGCRWPCRWLRWELFITTPVKAPRGKGDAKQLDGAKSDAKGTGEDGQGEQLAGAGGGGAGQQPGDEASPADDHQGDEGRLHCQVRPISRHHLGRGRCLAPWRLARMGSITRPAPSWRSSTMSQPMAMRPSLVSSWPRLSRARSSTTVLAVEGQAKHQAGGHGPVEQLGGQGRAGSQGLSERWLPGWRCVSPTAGLSRKSAGRHKHQLDDADFRPARGRAA